MPLLHSEHTMPQKTVTINDEKLLNTHEKHEDAIQRQAESAIEDNQDTIIPCESGSCVENSTRKKKQDSVDEHLEHNDEYYLGCTVEQMEELSCPTLFFNRDINWIQFNAKVLQEAFEPRVPLLEQLKFISIF